MATFIKIEPSTDIHLVLDPNFRDNANNPLNNLPLHIWDYTRRLAIPNIGAGFVFTEITNACNFDFFPIGQNFVTLAGTNLVPQNRGTAFMQVRFHDGAIYHYLIVRITVHDRMNSWWFGHEDFRMSVFRHDIMAHSQPSIYASFDADHAIGDITGHNYVRLTSLNLPAFIIANDPAKPYQGRIRGVAIGGGLLRGELMGINTLMNITVVDFAPTSVFLERVRGNWGQLPRNRHNMLFIAEGFSDKTKFDEVVHNVVKDLFALKRHSPYNLLEKDFNVWSVFQTSQHESLTTACRITESGYPFPFYDNEAGDDREIKDPGAPGGRKRVYTLKRLCELVGFSDRTLVERGVTPTNFKELVPVLINLEKARWQLDNTALAMGFDINMVPPDGANGAMYTADGLFTLYAWLIQVPLPLIPEVRDSYYGYIIGNRPGDKVSASQPLANEITAASPLPDFTRRIREWFMPNRSNLNFPGTVDPRRYAPDIYYYENNIESPWVTFFIKNQIMLFNEAPGNQVDPAFRVGQCWDFDFRPSDPLVPEIRSEGLVCFLINSALHGRSANNTGRFIMAIIGKNSSFIDLTNTGNNNPVFSIDTDTSTGERKLNISPQITINYDSTIGMVAHEFGHSFKLGDEYETQRLMAPVVHIHRFDNLMHYRDLEPINPPPAANLPKPIVPDFIKWSPLHRITHSAKIIENTRSTVANEIQVRISPEDKPKFDALKDDAINKNKIHIRKLIINFINQDSKQLRDNAPAVRNDIYTNLLITNISAQNVVTLQLTAQSNIPAFNTAPAGEASLVPAGSILYLPKTYDDGTPFTLIEKEVMEFMRTNRYDPAVDTGRALSENHNPVAHAGLNLDEMSSEKDHWPDISGFKGPCKDCKLIGLYEGGGSYVGDVYRPAGSCKMRNSHSMEEEGEFCFVCKYLMVSRVNPSLLGKLDEEYVESKERKWERILSHIGDLPDIPDVR